jgi:hypothetical protein
MRALTCVLLASTWCCPAAQAADRTFKDIVEAISDEFHTKPLRIPMFGLVNVVAFVARPAGARHIDLAIFEDLDYERRAGRDVAEFVRNTVGRNWKPFVTVTSRRRGQEETTLIYMREDGGDTRLLITSIERSEATVVQLRLNPDGLARWFGYPRESAHNRYGQ